MKIKNLQDVEIFVAAADGGGLSAAARLLGLSPAVTCAALKRLEASLGVALFVRTMRSMRLTIEGERLLARAQPVLDSLRAAENEAMARQAIVEGQVQLSLPSDLGRHQVLEWLNDFSAKVSPSAPAPASVGPSSQYLPGTSRYRDPIREFARFQYGGLAIDYRESAGSLRVACLSRYPWHTSLAT